MSNKGTEIVVPGHPRWKSDNVYFKVNESLWRRFTRNRYGNGRNFSEDGFQDDILDCVLPHLFYITNKALPRQRDISWSDRIYVDSTDCDKVRLKKISQQIKNGGDIGLACNLGEFYMEALRFLFKFTDHQDVDQFLKDYQAAEDELNTTQDVIGFLISHVGKYHAEVDE